VTRTFAVTLSALAVAAFAGGRSTAQPPGPDVPVFKIAVRPAAAPSPALRYRLLPELRDQQPGNALLLYYKAFSPELQHNIRTQAVQAAIEKATETPIDELRKDAGDVRWVQHTQMMDLIDQAARRSYIDWELTQGVREHGIGLLLPDVQAMRQYANYLAVRARLDVADGNYDRAVYGLQTGVALARHLSEAPTLIHDLVGIAVAAKMFQQIDTLIQQPGAPNLYWALSDLPHPLIDLHKGYQGERLMIEWLAPGVRDRVNDPSATPMTPEQLQTIADRIANIEGGRNPAAGVPSRLLLSVLTAQRYPAAKQWLASRGWTAEQIEAIPVAQAALMYEVYTYDRLFDEMAKWHGQPAPVALAGLEQAKRQLQAGVAQSRQAFLSAILLPATERVYQASLRVERRVAALRCVEAIRLHAAARGGKLPASLNDITEVPVPPDPATGQPFPYSARGDTATLTAGPYAHATSANDSFTYELTLAK
jgi:hypothetical protein